MSTLYKTLQTQNQREVLYIAKWIIPIALGAMAIICLTGWTTGVYPEMMWGFIANTYILIGFLLVLPYTLDVIYYPEIHQSTPTGKILFGLTIAWPYTMWKIIAKYPT